MVLNVALVGTDNTHGHQFAGFLNGWSPDVPIPYRSKHGFLPQFYTWAKGLREAENDPAVEVPAHHARVTSIWCTDTKSAELIARACGIERIADSPAEAIDGADAVLLLTEDPANHFEIAKLAFERGLPTFVDKPLTVDAETNRQLTDLAAAHAVPWFTGSALRFSPSLHRFAASLPDIAGEVSAIYVEVAGPLEYYGIHALEVAHQIVRLDDVTQLHGFGAGGRGGALISLANSPTTVLAETILTNLEPPTPSFDPPAHAVAYGSKGHARWAATDTPLATLGLVTAFVDMARTGVPPLPPTEGLALANLALDLTTAAVSAQPVQH